MTRYLSQLDIDVFIYITEDDIEYQVDSPSKIITEENIWKQFSELALSLDSLEREIHLSKKAAKLVFDKRKTMEFLSQADVDTISLAKRPLEQIKKYIREQHVVPTELPGMKCEEKTRTNRKKHLPIKKQKAVRQENVALSETSLFSSDEIAL
ncbi:MAG: hypothetical protein NVS4B12_23790 [Ktedonobacteraceae bacterium]